MQILSQMRDPSALPPGYRREIRALERDREPELAEEGLWELSNRMERDGRVEAAAELYQVLAGQAQPRIASRARDRLNVMAGHSAGPARWEYLADRFSEELFDPASLVGMGVAGMAFRSARLFTLSRIARLYVLPSPRLASLAATTVGLSAEIPAFVLASRLARQAQGHEVPWSVPSLGHDLASTGLLLGSLRLSGTVATTLLRPSLRLSTLETVPWRFQIGVGLGQQAAMFGGILASHYLQSELGLRSVETNAVWLSEGLATLLQFNAAGRVARIAFGPRWAAYERVLDLSSQSLQFRINDQWISVGQRPMPRPGQPYPVSTWRGHLREILLSPMWMAMGAGGIGGGTGNPRQSAATSLRPRANEFRSEEK